ncbi:hypothetical protein [Carnobacterium funditum]|uniref:hypothetical protein n=1 Tax=Carnobacterium funditum TaxID=2752 RepID=UPI00054F210E|nr:hypothetical protein [Carnobacterium funditum]
MKYYILIAFMSFFILIKLTAMIKLSKGHYSSKIIQDWTFIPLGFNGFEELTKEKQTVLKSSVYLSCSLDILFAVISMFIVRTVEIEWTLILVFLLYLNPILFSNHLSSLFKKNSY